LTLHIFITPTLTLPSPRRKLYEPEAVDEEGIIELAEVVGQAVYPLPKAPHKQEI